MKQILLMILAVVMVGCGKKPVVEQQEPKEPSETEKKKFNEIKAKAEAGNARAQYNLSLMYVNGEAVPDFKEFMKWLHKAAEQGEAEAQYNLAAMYYTGNGVAKDFVTAYVWLTITAANGDSIAKRNRDGIAKTMTPDQIDEGQKLSEAMIKRTRS
jgi:TPR repeat protein